MENRVVITGLGVVAPNAIGVNAFHEALANGISGISFFQELKDLGFSCCVGGKPVITDDLKQKYFSDLQLRGFNSSGILYGCIAGIDAWKDAELEFTESLDYGAGIIFGTGTSGVDKFREAIYKVDDKQVRRLGSTVVAQTMASGISAYLGGILHTGNQVTTNSSACNTGTESIIMGYERIRNGQAKRMLVGGCSDHGPYVWGGFDAMRVLSYKYNDQPEKASRPMSADANGFVPGAGAGALLLESLESALNRGVKIYAEIAGAHVNSGGQMDGGSMTAPNSNSVIKCIESTLDAAKLNANQIDAINGHLTATIKDPVEIENWCKALGKNKGNFPFINSNKSLIGHCLAASGAIESVASILQINHNCVYPNINCEDLHPKINELIGANSVPTKMMKQEINTVIKASFGFGDVNGCIIFKNYSN